MHIVTSGIRLLLETKNTLVTVNRTITGIDPFYVRIAWAGSAISSLQQLGVYTLLGGLVGHVLEKVAVDWKTVTAGIALYLSYRFAETAVTAIFTLRTKRFELTLVDLIEERMLAKLASLDLGRLLDPSFIELHRMAQSRGTGAILFLWQMQRALVACFNQIEGSRALKNAVQNQTRRPEVPAEGGPRRMPARAIALRGSLRSRLRVTD